MSLGPPNSFIIASICFVFLSIRETLATMWCASSLP